MTQDKRRSCALANDNGNTRDFGRANCKYEEYFEGSRGGQQQEKLGVEGGTLGKLIELEEAETRGGRSLFRWSE